jgi:hypothetical protein
MTRFVPEQDREQAQLDLLATLRRPRDGQHDPVHLDLLTETGREFSAECLVWGVDRRGGILAHCFVRDVTERRRAQQTAACSLPSSRAQRTRSSPRAGRPDHVVERRCRADVRLGPGGGGGLPSYIIVPLDKVPEHTEMIARVFAGDPVRGVETERVSRGGARIPVEVRMSPVPTPRGRGRRVDGGP